MIHPGSRVVKTGGLWHASSADGLEQCALGCWVEAGTLDTHVCPRLENGPIEIRGLPGIFARMADAELAMKQSGRLAVLAGSVVVRVHRSGRSSIPIALDVVVPQPRECLWVKLVWSSAQHPSIVQYTLVWPSTQPGQRCMLIPRTDFNQTATPLNIQITSVSVEERCSRSGMSWGTLFGVHFLKWKSIKGSRCSTQHRRYPWIHGPDHTDGSVCQPGPPCEPMEDNIATFTKAGPCTPEFGMWPCRAPRVSKTSEGYFKCGYCGAEYETLYRWYADCAPDADYL